MTDSDNFSDSDDDFFDKLAYTPTSCKSSCCETPNIILNDKEAYNLCLNCGKILDQILNTNPDISYENGESTTYGMPTSYFYPKASLGTTISGPGYNNLRRRNDWGQMIYKEKSLLSVCQYIEDKCNNNEYRLYKSIRDGAKCIYLKLSNVKHPTGEYIIFRGKNRKSIIAGCIFFAAIREGYPCTNKEIAKMFDIDPKQLTKGTKKIKEFLFNDPILNGIHSALPSSFIKSYKERLHIPEHLYEKCIKICNNISKLEELSSHQPSCIAAGSVFLLSKLYKLNISKKEIAEVLKISEVTINKLYEEANKLACIIIDDNKTDDYLINDDKYLEVIIENFENNKKKSKTNFKRINSLLKKMVNNILSNGKVVKYLLTN